MIHRLMANRLNEFVYCPYSVSINVMSMLSLSLIHVSENCPK